jgi:hypothetical protein
MPLVHSSDLGPLVMTARVNNHAVTNPGTADDQTKGWEVGSLWVNTANNTCWQCTRATANNANWVQIG